MNKLWKLTLFFTLSLCMVPGYAECIRDETGTGEIIGTLAGAAIGGFIGSRVGSGAGNKVAIGAGVVAGGFLGNRIGAALDCKDQQYHYESTQKALETQKTGQSIAWNNPDSGHSGSVMPTRTYTAADGVPCREFTQTIYVDGKYEEAKGNACRQLDGTWKPA